MRNSKSNLKSALILNTASLLIMFISLLSIWAGIRQNVQDYGFSYNVTTIIDNITVTEQIEVKDQFVFSMVLLSIVLINILNVVHFRGKLNEAHEESD